MCSDYVAISHVCLLNLMVFLEHYYEVFVLLDNCQPTRNRIEKEQECFAHIFLTLLFISVPIIPDCTYY